MIVTAETAEVREGPAPNYDVITVVAKGEIFVKQGRTGAWYYIKINDDTFGWISGRAIRRYQEEEAPSTYVEPRDEPVESGDYPYYPYYPASTTATSTITHSTFGGSRTFHRIIIITTIIGIGVTRGST